MPERASVFETCQIGVEVTPGTAVAATKKLASLDLQIMEQVDIKKFRPMGQKFNTVSAIGKEWTGLKLGGVPTYNELIYPFSSLMETAAITTLNGTGRQWLFNPSPTGPDTQKTYTVENGSSVRAHRAAHGLITGVSMEFSRDEVTISGDGISHRLEDGFTITPALTQGVPVPIVGNQVNVYLADTQAGLPGTALARVLKAGFNFGDRYSPLWPLNRTHTSFATFVEKGLDGWSAKLLMEADAEGMGLLTTMRANSSKFMRIHCEGATISGSTDEYTFQMDMALKVANVSEFKDEDGVFAIEWEFMVITDPTWAKAVELTIINAETAL